MFLTLAREDAADTLADKIQTLADRVEKGELDPHRGRVSIDALKWVASKLKPQSYGDRIHQEHSGAIGGANVADIKPEAPEWLKELIGAREERSTDGDDKVH